MSAEAWVAIVVALIAATASVVAAIIGTRNKQRLEEARADIETGPEHPAIGSLTTAIHDDVQALKRQQRRTFVSLLKHLIIDHDKDATPRDTETLLDDLAEAEERAADPSTPFDTEQQARFPKDNA